MFDDKIISNISGILVLSLPFIGFIVGYFIEILMSAIEHILYSVGVPRLVRASSYYFFIK
jgi:hypothetical protein